MAVLGRSPSHSLGRAAGGRLGIPGVTILAAGLVAAAALLPVAQSSSATTTGREIRLLETRRADLNARIYQTQTEVAQLGAIEGVEQRARDLGMVPADRWLYVTVAQPPPVVGMPARFLNEEGRWSTPNPPRTWWEAVIDRLPLR